MVQVAAEAMQGEGQGQGKNNLRCWLFLKSSSIIKYKFILVEYYE